MSRREQSSFSTSSIFRALGIRSHRQSPVETEQTQPVMIMADFSRSFAPEQIEARGLAMMRIDSQAPHDYCNVMIESRAPGGIVFEAFGLSSSAGAYLYCQRLPTKPWTGNQFFPMSIGGLDFNSFASWNHNQIPPAILPAFSLFPSPMIFPTERLYVPAGWVLHFGSQTIPAAAHSIWFELVWREIPEILGAP